MTDNIFQVQIYMHECELIDDPRFSCLFFEKRRRSIIQKRTEILMSGKMSRKWQQIKRGETHRGFYLFISYLKQKQMPEKLRLKCEQCY